MEINLVLIGAIFLVLSYLVGVKKLTWLLAGYNEKKVKDKNKLARLVGITLALLGAVLLISGIAGVKEAEYIMMSVVAILLIEVVYVNAKMVK